VAASTASYLLIQPLAGLLADRFGPTRVTFAGLAVSAVAIMLVPFATGTLLLFVAILGGVGVGTVWTNTDTAVSNLATEGRLDATLGAAGSFKELGDMLGPLVIGFVSQFVGLRVGFVACRAPALGPSRCCTSLVKGQSANQFRTERPGNWSDAVRDTKRER
jgi:MFS family permease